MILVNTDVVVVGAGPIGCYSALQAAKQGVQVVVCEEHPEVGVPSHCTGHISLAGIKRLELNLPKSVIENEIESAIFYSPACYKFSVRFASPVTRVINRRFFDQHLSNMASKAGAKIFTNTYADSFLIEKGFVKGVIVKRKKKTEKLLSKVVIDAEGISSNLLKRLGLPSLDRNMIVNAVQAEVDKIEGINDNTVEVFLSRSFAQGFFAWIVPRRDGTAKIGLGTARGNPHDCLRYFISHNPVARQRLKRSHISSLTYHPISLGGPISRTFHDGLLVVGDAASQVKPTTGGGIIMGLTCAKIAGKSAAYAVNCKDSSSSFLSEYERQWKKNLGFDMAVMKRLRMLLDELSDRQLDHTIALCAHLGLEETLKNVKDVDFQGTSLIRIAKSPRILATALYLLKLGFHVLLQR